LLPLPCPVQYYSLYWQYILIPTFIKPTHCRLSEWSTWVSVKHNRKAERRQVTGDHGIATPLSRLSLLEKQVKVQTPLTKKLDSQMAVIHNGTVHLKQKDPHTGPLIGVLYNRRTSEHFSPSSSQCNSVVLNVKLFFFPCRV